MYRYCKVYTVKLCSHEDTWMVTSLYLPGEQSEAARAPLEWIVVGE